MASQIIINIISFVISSILIVLPFALIVYFIYMWKIKRNVPEGLKGGSKNGIEEEIEKQRGEGGTGGSGRRGWGRGYGYWGGSRREGERTFRRGIDPAGRENKTILEPRRRISAKSIDIDEKPKSNSEGKERTVKRDWPSFE